MLIAGQPLTTLLASALIVTLGAAVQGAVGFGMALTTVPLLLWTGRPLSEAVAVLFGASLVQTAFGAWTVRHEIPWRTTLWVTAAQWATVPIGVLGMGALAAAGPTVVRQAVGGILVGVLALRFAFRPRPREQLARGWSVVAGASAGFLAGLVGMAGPPIVLFALAHPWSKNRLRGFLWASFLLMLPAGAVALAWRMGIEVLAWSLLGLALAPCSWLGSLAGMKLSRRWSSERLRVMATAMLGLVAASSIIGPLLGGDPTAR